MLRTRLSGLISLDAHAKNGHYTIRSLYFDDYDDRCLLENENGTDPREKFRIRIYNGSAERISLEEVLRALPEQDRQLIQLRFYGNRTQSGSLFAGHTDYIFSSMGEELGFVGCLAIMIMEMAIIARCIYVGIHCQDYMRRLVCYGAASALMFQVMINTGMCIGVMPVIGLTLPLISYGGSSVVTIYAMLGLVSGAHARPQSLSHERYVQPYR